MSTPRPENDGVRSSSARTWLRRLGAIALGVQGGLIALTGLALALLMVLQTVLRYGLEEPFLGIEETAVLLGLWFYFLGLSYATRSDAQIKGGVAALVIKNPQRLSALRLAGTLVSLAIGVVFTGYAAHYWLAVHDSGRESTYMGWPKTLWVASMVVGFVLMTTYLALQALREWRSLRARKRPESDQ